MKKNKLGKEIYGWAEKLFPINRSITGIGGKENTFVLEKTSTRHIH